MSPTTRFTIYQTVVAVAALVGVTVLGVTGNVPADTVTVIYSAVIGAGLGAGGTLANGYAQRKADANSGGQQQ